MLAFAPTGRHDLRPDRLARGNHPAVRLAILVLAVVAAYHVTLATLLRGLTVDSPLAYLGLVPVLALGVGLASARPGETEPEIHDRYLDWIVAIPLVVAALAVNVFLPRELSTMFWVWRVDLLTLPLFVAGAVLLLFGTRMLMRVKWAVLLLFLAWPVPLRTLLAAGLDPFTRMTARLVAKVAIPLGLAAQVPGGDGSQFRIEASTGTFDVIIASACSGANSMFGFLVVAPCMLLFVRGSWGRRVLWLGFGLATMWLGNMLRLVGIIAVGKAWGERIALETVHPYAGLLLFILVMLAMVAVAPRFGLEWRSPLAGRRPVRSSLRSGTQGWLVAGAVTVVVAALLTSMNAGLREMSPVANAFGQAQLAPFSPLSVGLPGFQGRRVDNFGFARQFFGQDSDWTRYEFAGPGNEALATNVPVTADVVTSSDLQTFEDFDIQSCYSFHGYETSPVEDVELGAGVVGHLLTWRNRDLSSAWTTLYWHWPVEVLGRTRYQRIALLIPHDVNARLVAPIRPSRPEMQNDLERILDRPGADDEGPTVAAERDVLVAFGTEMVEASVARAEKGPT